MKDVQDDEDVYLEAYYSHFDDLLATIVEKLVLQPATIEELVTE